MKKKNPPAKSPLMKMFTDTIAARNGADPEEKSEDADLALDSIGCTANVVMLDYAQ